MKLDKKLSFVIPCYYSEKTISLVVEDILRAFPEKDYNYEIILINDGSEDNTYAVLHSLAENNPRITAVNLAKNFGQDAALMAGYTYATGDYIISLDDDCQNPPEEAHKLIARIEEGYDAVFGKYHVKQHSAFKNWGSRLNDKMATALLKKPKDLTLCSYFIMTSFVKDEMLRYDSAFPYIWGLILRTTDHISNVYIEHKRREIGDTTFTFGKLVMLWLNGFTSFSVKPLRLASLLGGFFSLLGFLLAVIMVIRQIIHPEPITGWTSLMCTLLIVSGINMMMLGLAGEYIGRIFISQNKSPQFVVRQVYKKEN